MDNHESQEDWMETHPGDTAVTYRKKYLIHFPDYIYIYPMQMVWGKVIVAKSVNCLATITQQHGSFLVAKLLSEAAPVTKYLDYWHFLRNLFDASDCLVWAFLRYWTLEINGISIHMGNTASSVMMKILFGDYRERKWILMLTFSDSLFVLFLRFNRTKWW